MHAHLQPLVISLKPDDKFLKFKAKKVLPYPARVRTGTASVPGIGLRDVSPDCGGTGF